MVISKEDFAHSFKKSGSIWKKYSDMCVSFKMNTLKRTKTYRDSIYLIILNGCYFLNRQHRKNLSNNMHSLASLLYWLFNTMITFS